MVRVVFLSCFLAIAAGAAWGDIEASVQWPQFRGPNGQGRSDARGLPLRMGEGENVRWKTPIHGKAWSSPVILDDQVWMTTATPDGRELFAVCVDARDGKIIHDRKVFDVSAPQYCHPFNSYASPTPVVEPGRVYVTFGSPGTACLDAKSGETIWERRDLACNHYRAAGSSPILHQNLLVMHFDGSDVQYIAALDKNTGKMVWKTDRSIDFKDLGPDGKPMIEGDLRKAFSTPVVGELNGKPILVSLASKAIYAYDPAGKELWRMEYRASHSGSPTPQLGAGLIFYCTGLSRGDLLAVRPDGSGIAWKQPRNVPTRSSPVLVDNLIYMVDDGGIASCVDAKTGAALWRQRLKGEYSASPLYADGRIYLFSEHGNATALATGREFKNLAEGVFESGFMASPAAIDGALFIRSKTHLYRVENPGK